MRGKEVALTICILFAIYFIDSEAQQQLECGEAIPELEKCFAKEKRDVPVGPSSPYCSLHTQKKEQVYKCLEVGGLMINCSGWIQKTNCSGSCLSPVRLPLCCQANETTSVIPKVGMMCGDCKKLFLTDYELTTPMPISCACKTCPQEREVKFLIS